MSAQLRTGAEKRGTELVLEISREIMCSVDGRRLLSLLSISGNRRRRIQNGTPEVCQMIGTPSAGYGAGYGAVGGGGR